MSNVIHTAITYDHDRRPLEEFLRATGYEVVTLDVDNKHGISEAVQSCKGAFVVVASLINSRHVHLGAALHIIDQHGRGEPATPWEMKAAGLSDIHKGNFGDQLAEELNKLPIPHLTVIFSSQIPSASGPNVKFVNKAGASRDIQYAEILDAVDIFYANLSLAK